jgi:hypothetical protein
MMKDETLEVDFHCQKKSSNANICDCSEPNAHTLPVALYYFKGAQKRSTQHIHFEFMAEDIGQFIRDIKSIASLGSTSSDNTQQHDTASFDALQAWRIKKVLG